LKRSTTLEQQHHNSRATPHLTDETGNNGPHAQPLALQAQNRRCRYPTTPTTPMGGESLFYPADPQTMRDHGCLCVSGIHAGGISAYVHMAPTLSADLTVCHTTKQTRGPRNQPLRWTTKATIQVWCCPTNVVLLSKGGVAALTSYVNLINIPLLLPR
jgi:hypothetical protein